MGRTRHGAAILSDPSAPIKPVRPLGKRNVLNRSTRFGPNMTPMVDVTLVILIFFMASATIAGQEWFLRADLPEDQDPNQTSSGFALPVPMLSADMFMQDEQILVRGIGDAPRSLESVIEQIQSMNRQASEGLVLSIRAGDKVPYSAVIALHDAAESVSMRVAFR